jgi:transcriptional regulator with XRE-family HTH domain
MRKLQPGFHSREYRVFRAILIAARQETGHTQAEVAKALGRPQSFVAKVENGERRVDVTEFVEIAQAMNIDPKKLFARYLAALR